MDDESDAAVMETVAMSQSPASTDQETTRAERWKQRVETVSNVMRWLAPRVRPVAEQAATIAKATGQVAGTVIKTGGSVIGAGVAGVGLVAVGGPAGATVAAVGAGIGASSWVGGWFAEKVGEGAALGFDITGVVTEKTLHVSDTLIQGIHSVLTKSQTEILLGDEGAAVLEHVMDVHKESKDVVSDVTYIQLLRGMIGYACLQRAMHVAYSNRGFVSTLTDQDELLVPRGPAAFKRENSGPGSDDVEGELELRQVLRLVEMAHAVYGAVHNALVGDGTAMEVLAGNRATAAKYLSIPQEDILEAEWDSPGPHSPAFMLVADRENGLLVLSIRGTMSSGDILTDLRCRAGSVRVAAEGEKEAVHVGMWETAVRLDARLGDAVEEALAGSCAGLSLRVTGHSLGAGVATLLSLRWQRRFTPNGLRCVAFAPPCTVSLGLSATARGMVTSVVLADDAVCRWSLGSTKDVLRAAGALGRDGADGRLVRITLTGSAQASGGSVRGGARDDGARAEREGEAGDSSGEAVAMEVEAGEEAGSGGEGAGAGAGEREVEDGSEDAVWCLSLQRTLEADMQEDKLYPAGRVLWVVREASAKRQGEAYRCVERRGEDFARVVFSRTMLSDHLVHNYDRALRGLLPGAAPE